METTTTSETNAARPGQPGKLSVVIPVYNERDWAMRSVAAVDAELQRAGWSDAEVIIVDDGSTDGSGDALDAMHLRTALRVIHQQNHGRLRARLTGLDAADGEYVLLLDSRVLIGEGSLRFVRNMLDAGAVVWTSHVHINTHGNPLARFWDVVARLAWARYFDAPRTTSFGLDDFDHYPKGTGCFFAPRALLVDAYAGFSTYYSDPRHSNDDTSLIRNLAAQTRVWVSPEYYSHYEARDRISKFLKHAHHRGVVFIDGHMRRGARFAPVIVLFFPASLLAFVASVSWWALPFVGVVVLVVGSSAAVLAKGYGWRNAVAVGAVTPLFVVGYGLGMWRGLWLIVKKALAR